MKLLIFTIIALVPLNALSSKCQNPKKTCIKLCCAKSKIFNHDLRKCEDMPNTAASIISWNAILSGDVNNNNSLSEHISETLELLEYGPCIGGFDNFRSDLYFDCYSPYYHNESKRYVLKQFSMGACAPPQNTSEVKSKSKSNLKTFFGILFVNLIPFCLPALALFCTCIRKSNRDIEFDLVLWYMTSVLAYPLNLVFSLSFNGIAQELISDYPKYWDLLTTIFSTSTFLWPNVIGFEIWIRFKETTAEHTIVVTDQKRLIWYIVFVWGVTFILVLIGVLISKTQWSSMREKGPHLLISIISLIHFITLSLKIFISGNKVIKVANEKLRLCLITKVILRLCVMMAIPRMCCVMLLQVTSLSFIYLFMLFVEPFTIVIFYKLKRFI